MIEYEDMLEEMVEDDMFDADDFLDNYELVFLEKGKYVAS